MNQPAPKPENADLPEQEHSGRRVDKQAKKKSAPEADSSPLLDDSWQNTIWREWRSTNDEEYAGHLFALVADEPVERKATIINVLLGLFYGGLAGLLIALLVTLGDPAGWVQVGLMLTGIGAAIGSAAAFVLRQVEGELSTKEWLARLTLNSSPGELALVGVALAVGLFGSQIGWMLGWSAGLGHMVGIVSLSIFLAASLGLKLVSWLTDLRREPNPRHLHQYRKLWFWWRPPPQSDQLDAAFEQAYKKHPEAKQVWGDVIKRFIDQRETPVPPDELVANLIQSRNWTDRFVASHLLVACGGLAVASLAEIAGRVSSPMRGTATRLLHSIEMETTYNLADKADTLLCPTCLTRCIRHQVQVSSELTTSFYGCRTCSQSREFLEGNVVAVLDANTTDDVDVSDTIRINWLARRELFDFDSVEIVQAGDEDIERFAVQVGNDTDPFRQRHYKTMSCKVAPGCDLSENTVKILQRMFGTVGLPTQRRFYAQNLLDADHTDRTD